MIYLVILLTLICIASICYYFCSIKPKLQAKLEIDKDTEEYNKFLSNENAKLVKELNAIRLTVQGLKLEEKDAQNAIQIALIDKSTLHAAIEALKTHYETQKEIYEKALEEARLASKEKAEVIQREALEVMQNAFDRQVEQERAKYLTCIEDIENQYHEIREDNVKYYTELMANLGEQSKKATKTLLDLAEKVKAATKAWVRDQEEENKDFFKINISNIDLLEIEKIKSVLPYLRNGRPIAKAIWECYYRNPTSDMVSRVIGAGKRSGIYKITNQLDKRVYIGQAVDVADRLKTHVKCGLGIDAPATKLYTAMQSDGIENFTFELLIECAQNELNAQEKYWIEFYESNVHGYNMNAGGAKAK